MNINTIKQKLEEMLKETKESAQDQYLHDKTYIILDTRIVTLEKVLELFNKEEYVKYLYSICNKPCSNCDEYCLNNGLGMSCSDELYAYINKTKL